MADNGFVNLSDSSVQLSGGGSGKKANVFKGETGVTYRIWFPSESVCQRKRHWSKGFTGPDGSTVNRGYYRCTSDTAGYCPVCASGVSKPQQTFGANVIVYDTDPTGRVVNPDNIKMAFWSFSPEKFGVMRSLTEEWGPIQNYDLIVTCTDKQFQKMTISPAKTCIVKEQGEALMQKAQALIEADSVPLDKFLCRDVSVAELAGVFGIPDTQIPPQFINDAQTLNPAEAGTQPPFAQPGGSQNSGILPQAQVQSAETDNYASLDDISALLN